MDTVLGTDVSVAQGHGLDWKAIAATGVRFVAAKATDGRSYVDPTFDENITHAGALGIITGSYHVFRPNSDPDLQAQSYFKVAGARVEMPPAMDFELLGGVAPALALARALRFVEVTESLWGKPCLVYLYPYFWQILGNDAKHPLGQRPLWISHYDVQHPLIPNAWSQSGWTFWQYDGNGGRRFPGGMDADFDIFNGSEDDLRRFLVACVSPPGPAQSPTPPSAQK
jgi:lysozyme